MSKSDHLIPILSLWVVSLVAATYSFGKLYPDSLAYLAYINGEFIPPFCYRPLLPSLARLLPVSPVSAFALLNTIFLVALTTTLYLICIQVGATSRHAVIATTLATISFPVLFYATAVLVDVSYIFFLSLMVLCMLHPRTKDNIYVILLIIVVGVCFKESAAIGSIIYLLYSKKLENIFGLLIAPLSAYLLCRLSTGFLLMDNAQDFWFPRFEFLSMLPDIALIIFIHLIWFIMMFVWIGLLIPVIGIAESKLDWFMPILVGTGGLMFYAMTAASFDGRFIWPLYLALTPLAALLLTNLGSKKED